ncbi:MAG: LamG-like jellyroll fold domain-containing protein [Bacteroidota bacterium]|nr:LamG-like jellyroll fold domain-containing protein [Bacteroidota bacterium]
MCRKTILFLSLTALPILGLMLIPNRAVAQPGDTTTVQTFEFEGFPVGEGWLSPREGFFDFSPIAGKTFSKVLMYYTLKCDNNQYPACGEWDYLSYTKAMEHTGRGEDPNFILGGEGGYIVNNYSYMNDVSWDYEVRFEETITYDNPTNTDEYEIGAGTLTSSYPFNSSLSDSRSLFLWTQSELSSAGMTSGDITGMQFNITDLGNNEELQKLCIKVKATEDNFLPSPSDSEGYTVVYQKNTAFTATGWQTINFTDFYVWDGISNLIVDISFSENPGNSGYSAEASDISENYSSYTAENDHYFNFNGPDLIHINNNNLNTITDKITISMWQYGATEIQPQNDCIFEAVNQNDKRVFSVHLPWGNGTVYWDAGDDTGYDRIEKPLAPGQFEGQWNHWAFVKNTNDNTMKMYLNGTLLQSGTGKNRDFGIIDSMAIGKGLSDLTQNNLRFYDGAIDEFRIWNTELDASTIEQWMYKDVDDSHPDIASLAAYYKFNETDGYTTLDEVTGIEAVLRGLPHRKNYRGKRFKNFTESTIRPNVKFNRNNSGFTVNSELVVDSFPKGQVMIAKYVQLQPNDKPVLDETIYVYPTFFNNYTYDENGTATDSVLVAANGTLTLEMLAYDTTDPEDEIVVPWEIGRFITPYGNGLDLGEDGWTWIFDVTDFQHLLQGNNVHLKAGNFQELLDLKFHFIEGTPPRNLLDIKNVYSANLNLSNFDEYVVDSTMELLPEAKMFKLKTSLTGHGFGSGNNCGEFCPNIHSVSVNGSTEFSWDILQECGTNPLYPQGGTWFYDRAGWCPGMPATVQNLELTPFINVGTDTEVDVDYDIEYDPYGNYITEIFFVSYADYNFDTDAEIERIIAPNNFKLNERFNPICGRPIINIKNNGADVLSSLDITYGIQGFDTYSYQWTGSLEFLEETEITLPPIDTTEFYNAQQNIFEVSISNPNGTTDEYIYNNSTHSEFDLADTYSEQLVVWFRTNDRYWENEYSIYDAEGNQVFSRSFEQPNTTYQDTLELTPGCYEFTAYDSGGDGMNNWPSGHGNGYIKFYNTDGDFLVNLEKWFGEYIRYNFIQRAYPVEIKNREISKVKIFPNPSNGVFNLEFIAKTKDYTVDVYSVTGRNVYSEKLKNQAVGIHRLDLSQLSRGLFFINLKAEGVNIHRKIVIK